MQWIFIPTHFSLPRLTCTLAKNDEHFSPPALAVRRLAQYKDKETYKNAWVR